MPTSLKSRLMVQGAFVFFVVVALLFVPAGTLDFWEAWVFLVIFFIPMIIFSIYYYQHDRALVERRMQNREKVTEQKWIMRFAFLFFLLGLLVPGLDHRFGWTRRWIGGVPLWVEIAAQALTLTGYLGTMWVIDVNRFAARTVQVERDQRVISSGPYGVVRHPMYSFALVMWLATATALGSYVALPFFALLIPVIVLRLLNEEKVLRRELPGYAEYCERTRYRLAPYIW
ncbi:MAG: isoprenylcysteine carboxylmethyltransferase family protein [Candidatus Acidiferrum sp.]